MQAGQDTEILHTTSHAKTKVKNQGENMGFKWKRGELYWCVVILKGPGSSRRGWKFHENPDSGAKRPEGQFQRNSDF